MGATTSDLSKKFKEEFWISKVLKNFEWWQKKVFIVQIDSDIQVLKVFKNYWKREIREIEIYEKYRHIDGLPRVITVSDFNGDTILFEEYIEWNPLEDIKENYLWNIEAVVKLINGIVKILEPLWDNKIVHRDLNPSNIIVGNDGEIYVIDFGIARDLDSESLTDTWFQPKTIIFSSPEQLSGKKELISYRSDFFNIWLIAYYLYYGELPFWKSREEILRKFDAEKLLYSIPEDCKFTKFFENVFSIEPSWRPRKWEKLLSLLP